MSEVQGSIAINFLLTCGPSLAKWLIKQGTKVATNEAVTSAGENKVDLNSAEEINAQDFMLNKRDFEILTTSIDVLQANSEKLSSMVTQQSVAELSASYSHVKRGLVMIKVQYPPK